MRRYFKLMSAFILALALICPLSDLGQAGTPSGTLVYSHTSNVGPLNPHLYSPNQMFAQTMVYEPLVRYAEGGRIIPWLAEKWDKSADGREYTFFLRKDVVFSDGTPFDAEAVKKNVETVLSNAKKHSWLEMIAQIQPAQVVDAHTVKLVLKDPYYPLLQDLALVRPLRFLSPTGFPEGGKSTAEGLKAPIGTGPWVLRETKLGEYDLFVRNEKYWGAKPAMERLLIKVIPDPNSRAVAFETGEIDLIYGDGQINLDTFGRYSKDKRYQTKISPPLSTRCVAMNTKKGATKELPVRKAILHAVDKDSIIKGVFLGTELRADTLFPPTLPYCDLGLNPDGFDPAKAAKLLDEAGWKKTGTSGVRSRDGQTLTVDLCFLGKNAVHKSIAEVIQAQLMKVGMDVQLIGEEDDSFYKRQHMGEFDLIFNDTWGPPYDPHSFVGSWRVPSHADFQAQSGLPNKAKIDERISQVLVSVDEKARQDMYREILTSIHDQAVYLPLSYTTGLAVHGPNLENVGFGATEYEIPFEAMKKK
jgi:nickel transport system substrate-binding protein